MLPPPIANARNWFIPCCLTLFTQLKASGTVWISLIVSVGATDITVDAKVQSADDTSGTNNTDIASLSVTQLTASDDNKQVILLVTSDDLNTDDVAAAVVVTVGDGTTGAYVSAIGIGFNARTLPATDNDVASVAEIVSL